MKIILTQPEIEKILRDHIIKSVTLTAGNDFDIEFAATRGSDGITATIDIPYLSVASLPVNPSATPRASVPIAAKNEDTDIAVTEAGEIIEPEVLAAAATGGKSLFQNASS